MSPDSTAVILAAIRHSDALVTRYYIVTGVIMTIWGVWTNINILMQAKRR